MRKPEEIKSRLESLRRGREDFLKIRGKVKDKRLEEIYSAEAYDDYGKKIELLEWVLNNDTSAGN